MAKIRNAKNKIFTSFAWIIAVLILAVAIIINMVVAKLDFNIDVSVQKLFSLSETSTKYLDQLDEENVQVDLYLLMNMNELEDDSSTRSLYRALVEYDSHDCINIIDFDPNENEAMLEKINPDNIYSLNTGDMILVCGENKRHINGISMYTTNYSYDSNGNIIESEEFFQGENVITSSIKAVVDGYLPTVYFLSGHGEKEMKDNYSNLSALMKSKNYRTASINLSDAEAVPDDAEIIIIAAPSSDITEREADKLNAYLDKGGSISVMLSPNGGEFDYDNLQKVIDPFCLEFDYNYIRETDSEFHISGDDTTIMCTLAEQEEGSALYADMQSLIESDFITYMPKSRSFAIDSDNSNVNSVETGTLMVTSVNAVGEPYGGTYDSDPLEGYELQLAVYSEDKNRNNAKVTLFGNAEFIDDEHIQDVSYLSSYYVYLSTITWMANQNLDMGIGDKSSATDYLSLTENTAYMLIFFFIALPIVIIIVGVGIWLKRRHS
ncbi:MAG: GldG family protein [Ruminococcus sp.]|nr:GldG family protein [Ruminococcus sp.]